MGVTGFENLTLKFEATQTLLWNHPVWSTNISNMIKMDWFLCRIWLSYFALKITLLTSSNKNNLRLKHFHKSVNLKKCNFIKTLIPLCTANPVGCRCYELARITMTETCHGGLIFSYGSLERMWHYFFVI